MYQVLYSRAATKTLGRLPVDVRRLIESKITRLAAAPHRAANVKRLAGHPRGWRLRVGDWRVVYTLDDERLIVAVVKIATRGEVYK
jgi:mRNA interferase RelE/StbE